MRRWPLVFAVIAAATLAPLSARATLITFGAPLLGATESPPVASPGTGSTIVSLNTDTHEMRVYVTFSGLVGNATVSHIHCCTALPFTFNVGVATALPSFPGFPAGVTSGSYDHIFNLTDTASWSPAFLTAAGGSTSVAEANLLAALETGRAYLNIHSVPFPAGELRGFLIPEPTTIALLAGGLIAAVGVRRRRR